jgi:DNA polymerase sigma
MRIIGKDIYLKYNDSQQARFMVEQFKQRGADVKFSSDGKWVFIDIFKISDVIRLGDIEIDRKEKSLEEIEEILFNFYVQKYKEAHFKVTI